MKKPLFRKQATEYQNNRLHGDVLITPKISYITITIIILALVGMTLAWLMSNSYAKKQTVTGWLEPENGIVKIYPNNSVGKVQKVFVENGQSVIKGQPLALVNGERILEDGTNLEEQLLNQYKEQRRSLERQRKRANELHAIREAELTAQINSALEDRKHIIHQRGILEKRLEVAQNQSEIIEQMHTLGHVSKIELNNTNEAALILASELQTILREQRSLDSREQQLRTDLARLPKEQANEIERIDQSLGELTQNIDQLRGQRAYVVKATTDGIVSNLQANIGQQTNTNIPLLSILPEGQHIIAKLLLPVSAVGFITEGQLIDIRYSAFPYQKYGLHKGMIGPVSKSILLPNELDSAPFTVEEPVYLAKASIAAPPLKATGTELPLKPGMTFTADIKIKDRTLIEWLFDPILSLKGTI